MDTTFSVLVKAPGGELVTILCSLNDAFNPDSVCYGFQQIGYLPSLGGNVFLAAIFAVCLLVQIFLGIRYRTWGFLAGMIGGITLEVVGYIGRILLHNNPFDNNNFLIYLICLTIGPAFLSAAVYLCLARIIVVYGESLSRFKPRTYTFTFIFCDFFSLVLQGTGGGIASTGKNPSTQKSGINIMIAGLSFQVFSLLLFMTLCADYAWNIRKKNSELAPRSLELRNSFKFKAFQFSLAVATLTIFIRSVYRVAELSQGFDGSLANQEVSFMILEGAMIVIAVLALTIFHPGVAFAGHWADANFKLKGRKTAEKDISGGSSNVEVERHGHAMMAANV